MEDQPTTDELRLQQLKRKSAEREIAERVSEADGSEKHQRRAEKAAYLEEKLAQRAEAERRAEEGS